MTTAWLVIAAGDHRQHAGNEGYNDIPSQHYHWDNTVANRDKLKPGHAIVIWDKVTLLGASIIEEIEEADGTKNRMRCPGCNRTQLKERETMRPRYRCYRKGCRLEFDDPIEESIDVHNYHSCHASAWMDLGGLLDAPALRNLCLQPKSIQSIRELDWAKFLVALGDLQGPALDRLARVTSGWIVGGHRSATVRVRVGQGAFRKKMLEQYGSVCAFSGAAPAEVLDAAHLYSFAKLGRHHQHGGMLLRKDLHRLFDLGLLAVDPATSRLSVHGGLRDYAVYDSLDGKLLAVSLAPPAMQWIEKHWKLHR